MKTIKINAALFICLLTMFMSSCTYDSLPTYEDVDRIYFTWAQTNVVQNSGKVFDKIEVNLGYDTPVRSDSTIYIPVSLMGHVSGKDRPINAELIKAESSAIEKQDIEILPSFIPAGKETGTLRIKINNTEKLETTVLMARIRLVPNECFHVDFTRVLGSSEKSALEYNVYFDAITEAPNLWLGESGVRLTAYFGEYSNVKLQLICDVCGVTRDFFMYDPATTEDAMKVLDARMPTFLANGMIAQVNRYLDQYKKEHNDESLTDENGKDIKMGIGIK